MQIIKTCVVRFILEVDVADFVVSESDIIGFWLI